MMGTRYVEPQSSRCIRERVDGVEQIRIPIRRHWFALLFLAGLMVLVTGTIALRWPEGRPMPRLVGVCGFVVATHLAGLLAWARALRGERNPIWEPTRRAA